MRLVRIRLLGSAVLIAALLPGLHGTSHAQEARGTITGTVLDSSKGVLPGAQVTVTNVSMGTDVSVITNDEGFFQATYLIPGTYRISVELSGFRTLVRGGIEVRVGDRLQFELALEVGGTAEEVTVNAAAPLLETSSGSLGQVIDARRVAELPIPHGDAFALIGLAAGTAFQRSSRLDRPFEPTHIVGFTMNGTRANRSDVTIDGIPSSATAERRRDHRVVRAAPGSRPGIQGRNGNVRRIPGQHRRGRHESGAEVRHQRVPRRGLLREDAAVDDGQRLLRERERHSADRLQVHPLGRHRRTARSSRTGRSSPTATKRFPRRARATTARPACRRKGCATAISRSCWRSDRSISCTTRSPPA